GVLPSARGGVPQAVVGLFRRAPGPPARGVTPLFRGPPAVLSALEGRTVLRQFEGLFGGAAVLLAGQANGVDLFVLDAPHLYARPGNPYLGPDGKDWPDNAQRFAALGYVAAEICRGILPDFLPDVLHAHDWQAALGPAYLTFGQACAAQSVITIHNLAFQGRSPAATVAEVKLPPRAYAIDGVEYYGGVGYLKGGLQCADVITTVSPTYAREICTPDGGMGLDGLLRLRQDALRGIV